MVDYSVGIFAESVNPNMFGSSRNIYYLAKALEEKGCQVTVFCPDYQANKEIDLNKIYVPFKRWKSLPAIVPVIVPQSLRIAKKAREMESEFDIFHSNSCYGFPYASNKNKPFVVHLRTESLKPMGLLRPLISDDFLKPQFFIDMPYRMIRWSIERYTAMKSDLVFCNSKETAIQVNKVLRIEPSKIKEVYNGVDTEFFLKGNGEKIREIYRLKDKKVLVCVMRLVLSKGINRLLSAMEIIAKKRADIVLLLVGGGGLESEVRRNIIKRGLAKSVILTGHITDDHLADFYATADLFVYPSSPGTILLEAMAASKSFILYYKSKDVPPGVPLDKIRDKKIGKVIKDKNVSVFAEEIINHIDDDEWLSKQGKKGFQYVKEELSWSKIADEVIKYYGQII